MKTILFLLIFLLQAKAVILTYPDGKKEFFVQEDSKSRGLENRAYYKNGRVSKKTLFKDTRKIYVSFKELADIEKFKNRYNLIMLKETNEMFHTYIGVKHLICLFEHDKIVPVFKLFYIC